ncbi:hypothetical protein Blue_028 [Bacillus phage Deep Blue]|uniref:Uncharacterized protein n=1 Tax=Bacillus phage Deep Blue TaxID=1792245 RepID=A0A140HLI9_9CAUD|nr:hypothetical protein Blue_028 [Bacillus phage Deep Blue]AMO25851.1 hypothetical protein Blue_028 [Bacillus phage Deep Blue]
MKIQELSKELQIKSFNKFIKFAGEMNHDNSHTFDEFIEVSTINNWEYDENGEII